MSTLMQHLSRISAYDPNALLNTIIHRLGLKDDNALSRKIGLALSLIRNIRAGRTPITATVMMSLHQATGIAIADLCRLAGDRRARFRPMRSLLPST
jgi:hypothetical protein